jgi:UDP-glucuronate 4-epimerase
MRVLVTGSAGFIGFHVVKRLLDAGATVVGFDNLNTYYDPALKERRLSLLAGHPGFDFVRGNLEDAAELESAFRRGPFNAIVHLAAQAGVRYSIGNSSAYAQSNLVGFLNILEACRQHSVRHLLFASSSSVYGLNSRTPFRTSDNVDHPVSLYAATKKSNELMAHAYSHLYRLPTTGLRFFTVYGPWGRPDMAYFSFTRAILDRRPIAVYNNGELWRDFTYIDDIVEGVVSLIDRIPQPQSDWNPASPNPATSSAPYRIFNVGNSKPVKLTEFIATLEEAIGISAIIEFSPMQAGDVHSTYADVGDLNQATGFAPSTSLGVGLAKFVAWYREQYSVPL